MSTSVATSLDFPFAVLNKNRFNKVEEVFSCNAFVLGRNCYKWKQLKCIVQSNGTLRCSKQKSTNNINEDEKARKFTLFFIEIQSQISLQGDIVFEIDLIGGFYSLGESIAAHAKFLTPHDTNLLVMRTPNFVLYFSTKSKEELFRFSEAIASHSKCEKFNGEDIKVKHFFIKKHFNSPTWCGACQKFVWGLGHQGFLCSGCHMTVHEKCMSAVDSTCGFSTFIQTDSAKKIANPNDSGRPRSRSRSDSKDEKTRPRSVSSEKDHSNNSNGLLNNKTENSTNHSRSNSISSQRHSLFETEIIPELDSSMIVFGNILGAGGYGIVYNATLFGKEVAVKVLHKSMKEKDKEAFKKEIQMLRMSSHPNIVLYIGMTENKEGQLMVVTEKLMTDLHNIFLKNEHKHTDIGLIQKLKMARDFTSAMAFLHSREPAFLHLDLKPKNLLLDQNGNIKVADFGLSREKEHSQETIQSDIKGTFDYMAPELIKDGMVSEKCDVYSFAIVTWEILYEKKAFDFQHIGQVYQRIVTKKERPSLSDPIGSYECIPSLKNLLQSCWEPDPPSRPSFNEIISKLNEIILEYEIPDLDGRIFWIKSFKNKTGGYLESVPWIDFTNRFRNEYSISDEDITNLDFILPHKHNSIFEKADQKVVEIEYFGEVLSWFGPMNDIKGFLTRINDTIRKPWFHGNVSKEEAYERLKYREAGTFLLRFSHQSPGCFAISVVAEGEIRKVTHFRVQYSTIEKTYKLWNGKKSYASLEDVVEKNRKEFRFPCPGSLWQHHTQIGNYEESVSFEE